MAEQDTGKLAGVQLLLVDDDSRNLYALSKVLKKHRLIIETAENGQLALDVLAEKKDIKVVLMDVMMPVMDGYTAMQNIRAQPAFASLPIIALTAKAMPEDGQKCLNAGANYYISKPIDVDNLLWVISTCLEKT